MPPKRPLKLFEPIRPGIRGGQVMYSLFAYSLFLFLCCFWREGDPAATLPANFFRSLSFQRYAAREEGKRDTPSACINTYHPPCTSNPSCVHHIHT